MKFIYSCFFICTRLRSGREVRLSQGFTMTLLRPWEGESMGIWTKYPNKYRCGTAIYQLLLFYAIYWNNKISNQCALKYFTHFFLFRATISIYNQFLTF